MSSALGTADTTGEMAGLAKAPTGIGGLDEVTGGGLPRGRPTLVCGPAGCGKTLLGMEFLVRGAREFGEPGVSWHSRSPPSDLANNVASLGFDLAQLERDGLLVIDDSTSTRRDRGDGRLGSRRAVRAARGRRGSVGAKRVVIDTIEMLFGRSPTRDPAHRARPAVPLAQGTRHHRGRSPVSAATALTRSGIEEYVSDCVIVLDHRVDDQTSTRRLRILKYRGSLHGTNEYPFLISERGIVLPITSLGLATGCPTSGCPPGSPGSTRCWAAASTAAPR